MKKEQIEYFDVIDSNLSEMIGKTTFTARNIIMKCLDGSATLLINNIEYTITQGLIFSIPDSVLFHVVSTDSDFRVRVIRLSQALIHEVFTAIDEKVIDVIQYSTPDLYKAEQLTILNHIVELIYKLDQNKNHAYKRNLIVIYLTAYSLELYELVKEKIKSSVEQPSNISSYIISRFYDLVHKHHAEHQTIKFYAHQLNISTRYLHRVTTSVLKLTPKQMVDIHLTSIAKRLLITTFMTNQEIAIKLNFTDQSSFGQFFKRNEGISPSEFRKRYK